MKRFPQALARASALACVAAAALVACGGSDDKYPTLTGDKPLVTVQFSVDAPVQFQALVYIPEKELILVRPGRSAALYSEVKKDPKPDALFKPTYAEPTAAQFAAVEELRDQAGRDVWKAQRADHLRECLLQGFMDFRSLTKRTGVGEGALLRTGLCVPKEERAHEHALSLGLSAEGSRYLHIAEPWALLLVKPGMELPLFERCDPAKAEYWCTLP